MFFLSARPIVESLARSTMPSSTTLFSSSRRVQRARPLGGLEQAKAISLASLSPSKIRATAGVARCLRLNHAAKPSSPRCDLWGLVHSPEEKKAARIAAELTPGVRAVVDNIIVQPPGSGWQ